MLQNFNKIEKKWQKIWEKERIYEPNLKAAQKPFYNLMMFPYPSAEGLHVGNMYAFTGSDIYGRFKRMQGYDVFEPIGLDGFGIHSENYALRIGTHPMRQAKISEGRFYRQLRMIGNGFAWQEHLETYDPEYYRWTQWIFVQLFKHGLAYRKKASVNWCPSCKTVLADEQVIQGKCERCSSKVVKKEVEQWFFRITKYAEKLLRNLEKIDWSEKVKISQRNWIGKSEGALIKFPISNFQFPITVFTTRPDTLFGATYMVLAPEHSLIENLKLKIENWDEVRKYIQKTKKKTELQRTDLAKEKTGMELKGVKAVNPATKKEIPIFVADYVLATYGTGAIMAVPAHDERDFAFAKKFKLPIVKVINPVLGRVPNPAARADAAVSELAIAGDFWEGEGELVNSGAFDGMDSEKARWAITKFVAGKKQVQYHLRDWLISRQRYWGVPIPMIYCQSCAKNKKGERKEMPGWYSISENQLPVKLPFVKDFRPKGKGESPLASVKPFFQARCPNCGSKARRETDVSDTFLDSAWYYLGYLILGNQKSKIPACSAGRKNQKSKSKIGNCLPAEASAQAGKLKIENSPFSSPVIRKWCPVNMYIGGAEHSVLHLLYSRFLTMVFYDLGFLHFEEPFTKFRAHGLLIREGAKISKSRGNIVNPDNYIRKFGADTLRMYLMFLAPFEQGGDFRDAGILGIVRFLHRMRKLSQEKLDSGRLEDLSGGWMQLSLILNRSISKVGKDIENLSFNTAISQLMVFLRVLEQIPHKDSFEKFLKLLAPFAPFITEELWEKLGHKTSIHLEGWPKYDPKSIKEETFELVMQINGRVRDKVLAPVGISQKEAEKLALSREKIIKLTAGQKITKIIFVPKRLINIVVRP